MNFDLSKIEYIYGQEINQRIKENQNDINDNINYFISLGFTDIEDIFERNVLLFLDDTDIFRKKINSLINEIGPDYINVIEDNLSLLEEIL